MSASTHIVSHAHIATRGTVFYDASCRFCVESALRFEQVLAQRGFSLLPLQTSGTAKRLGVTQEELLTEMRVQLIDGTVLGGADGVTEIARHTWWGWPLWGVSRIPGMMAVLRGFYRWIASQRDCANESCSLPGRDFQLTSALPLAILPLLTLLAAPHVPAWAFMWLMALAIYSGCKWLTYRQAIATGARANTRRSFGYLFAWPGMDATAFLGSETPSKVRVAEWWFALIKTLFGATVLLIATNASLTATPLVRGWFAMVGLVFVLHFGLFHLLSLAWRSGGVNAKPVMQNPLRSVSLSDFWGRRWNTAFHELAVRFTFRPLLSKFGAQRATLIVFMISGLIHDLVISVPAHGGYGLPTGYFLLQAVGISLERTHRGRNAGLGKGWRGWLFTMFFVAVPAFWLFHPPFVRNIILPMLQWIGTIGK